MRPGTGNRNTMGTAGGARPGSRMQTGMRVPQVRGAYLRMKRNAGLLFLLIFTFRAVLELRLGSVRASKRISRCEATSALASAVTLRCAHK
jgi:hypothetical protein